MKYKQLPVPSPTDDNGGGGSINPTPPKPESWFNKHLFQIGLAIVIIVTTLIVIFGTAK